MTAEDRQELIDYLEASRADVRNAVQGLSEAESRAKAEGGWSATDCVEHLVLIERAVRERVRSAAAEAGGAPQGVDGKEELLKKAVPTRRGKANAPPAFSPSGAFATLADALEAFEQERGATLQYVRECTDDLRQCGFEHFVFKALDGRQWMLLLAMHSTRHARQIVEGRAAAAAS
ncbi:MAG: DinB family protein [Bryobacteraceae bacterium]|nr:DinB family protein [Bryobacteraceae bacterium]